MYMRLPPIKEWGVRSLGAIEERTFEKLRHVCARLRRPAIALSLMIILGLQIYRYATACERVLQLEYTLRHAEQGGVQLSGVVAERHEQSSKLEGVVSQQAIPRYTLESITTAAVALGIRVDEVESGVVCTSHDSLSEKQIHISFTSSFSRMRQLYDYFYSSDSDLLIESVALERASTRGTGDTLHAEFCITVVTKTSWNHER